MASHGSAQPSGSAGERPQRSKVTGPASRQGRGALCAAPFDLRLQTWRAPGPSPSRPSGAASLPELLAGAATPAALPGCCRCCPPPPASHRCPARRPRGQPCPNVCRAHRLAVTAGSTDPRSVCHADARQPGPQPLAAAGHRPAGRKQPAHPRIHAPPRPGPLCWLPGAPRLRQSPHQPGALGEQQGAGRCKGSSMAGPLTAVPAADSRLRHHAGSASCLRNTSHAGGMPANRCCALPASIV